MPISADQRAQHLAWLRDITSLPTAAGHEQRVADFIINWCEQRPDLDLTRDSAGNLHVAFKPSAAAKVRAGRPVYFTAHMDHPAFVIERLISPTTLQLSFRGGVMDEYFKHAKVVAHDANDNAFTGTLQGTTDAPGPFKHYLCELDAASESLAIGDVVTWNVGKAEVIDNKMHTLACDDLAALAAALSAFDVLREMRAAGEELHDTRLLFTRAEEIGFIGAIAAVKLETMPRDARVIALENSRSFAESPIHAGPIVRVGDRVSVFSPTLTDAIAKRAEEISGGASTVTAAQKLNDLPPWKWQRKLMAGGACEASVFYNAGYEATCVCLPLGNYHNMADLDSVQAGTNTAPPVVAREFIGVDDYHGLVDLLVACGQRLPEGTSKVTAMVDKLWAERSFVLTT